MKAVIVISDRDNVATALQPLQAGQTVDAGGDAVTVIEPIASGHKVALRRINVGEPVIKYGSPIGTATVVIEPGAHVHTQNVASSRGRGDRMASEHAHGIRGIPSGIVHPPERPGIAVQLLGVIDTSEG